MPLREAAIVVALVNHPQLIDENFDQVEMPRTVAIPTCGSCMRR